MAEKNDRWDGDEYLNRPGQLESAEINARNLNAALVASGIPASSFGDLAVIEVGAGVGTVTRHLTSFGSVHAVEPSLNMLSVLARLTADLPNVTFSAHALTPASAEAFAKGELMPSPTAEEPERKLAPPRARFDVAVSTLVAHHVDDLESYFQGVRGILVEGGTFFILEFAHGPDGEDLSVKYHIEEKPKMSAVDDDAHHIVGEEFRATWTPEHLKGLFDKYGFTDCGVLETEPIPAFGDKDGRPRIPTKVVWGRKTV